jgi:hypothetical protein
VDLVLGHRKLMAVLEAACKESERIIWFKETPEGQVVLVSRAIKITYYV